MKARILRFPIIPRKEAFINWYERVGSASEISEYREFLNKNSAHKVVYVDFRRGK